MRNLSSTNWAESAKAALTIALLSILPVLAVPQKPTATKPARPAATVSMTPIKLGIEFPLTGSSKDAGNRLLHGMQLYFDEIHNSVAGRKLDLLIENDETSPATAKEKILKLGKQDKCPILAGVFMSNALYAIQPAIENELKVPLVIVSAGGDDISQRKRGKWMVRTCYTSSQVSHAMGDYAAKKLGYKKAVIICSDYAYGYEVAGGFQQVFEKEGGKVVQKLWPPLGWKDFKVLLKGIRPDADCIFLCTVGQSAEIIPKEIRELGFKQPLIGITASFDESFYPRMGDELVGAVSASLYTTTSNTAVNKKFVSAYRAKYHEEPGFFVEHGYAAAMWIAKAIESINGDVENSEKLLAALKKVQFEAPRGPIKLDEYGTSVDNVYIRRVERKNGALQNTIIHTYPGVSQFWTYDPATYLKQPSYIKTWPPCPYCSPPEK